MTACPNNITQGNKISPRHRKSHQHTKIRPRHKIYSKTHVTKRVTTSPENCHPHCGEGRDRLTEGDQSVVDHRGKMFCGDSVAVFWKLTTIARIFCHSLMKHYPWLFIALVLSVRQRTYYVESCRWCTFSSKSPCGTPRRLRWRWQETYMTHETLLAVAVCRQITSLNVMHIACVDHR